MGLFKNLVGDLTGKRTVYKATGSLTISGDLMEVRNFVKERCTAEYYNGTGANPDKERWLCYDGAKKCNIKDDTVSASSFKYKQEWMVCSMPCVISFEGTMFMKGTISLIITFFELGNSQKEVQKAFDIIKEAITDKFPQI